MKKLIFLLGFFIISFIIALTACEFHPHYVSKSKHSTISSHREYLALMKARKNHTLTTDVLEEVVANFLDSPQDGRSVEPGEKTTIISVKKLSVIGEKHFAVPGSERSITSSSLENETVELYAFITQKTGEDKPGYVLACNDLRIGNILGVVEEGSLDDHSISWFTDAINEEIGYYIDEVIEEYNSITSEEVDQAVARNVFGDVVETYSGSEYHYQALGTAGLYHYSYPDKKYNVIYVAWEWNEGYYTLIPVTWGQSEPYNYVVNAHEHNGLNYLSGCGPVAVAQLMAYFKYPPLCTINDNFSSIGVNCHNYQYHWDKMTNSKTKNKISNEGAMDIAVLMYNVGHYRNILFEGWGVDKTDRSHGSVISSLINMGYWSYDSFLDYNFSQIKGSIIYGSPVIVNGRTDPSICGAPQGEGHYWIIDAVRNMIYYEKYINPETNIYTTYVNPGSEVGHIPLYSKWVHCNIGWDGTNNAWYMNEIFDFRNYNQSWARSAVDENFYRYDLTILPYINY